MALTYLELKTLDLSKYSSSGSHRQSGKYLQDVQASFLLHEQTQSVGHVEKVRNLEHIKKKTKMCIKKKKKA